MALSTIINKVIHDGNDVATSFAFTFPILEASHLTVIYTDADDVETTLSASLYSVTGIGGLVGGAVTYPLSGSPIATGTKITLVRTVPYTQTTVLSNQGGYYPEVVERRFDLVYMALQQLDERVGRYTLSSISDPATEQSNYALIQILQEMDLLTTRGDLLTRDSDDYKRLARGTAGQFLGVSGSDLAWATPAYPVTGVRQTVQAGPVDTAGLPTFLPATNAALSITTQNLSSNTPLVASAANGAGASGPVDTVGIATADFTWAGLTLNRAAATPNFLYGTIAAGVITPLSTILPPVYQWGGTPATTAGQITFNIAEMKAYLGNGTTAPQTNLVVFGEAATDATTVISTVAYAYNGLYDSGYNATLGVVNLARVHNVGAEPGLYEMHYVLQCTTADQGYAVGETVIDGVMNSNVVEAVVRPVATRTAVAIPAITTNVVLLHRTAGTNVALTLVSWKWKITVKRGW